jgi:HK97 family phage major capsid protein
MAAISDLQTRLQELHDNALAIRATAEGEKRDLTSEEVKELDAIFSEFDMVTGQIERFARLEQNHRVLQTPGQRRTEPDNPADRFEEDPDGVQARSPAPVNPDRPAPRNARVTEVPISDRYRGNDKGTWGWKAMGDFAQAVRRASVPGGHVDPRLDVRGQPSSYGSEGVDADGGFAVPPDFRTAIREKMMGVESLLPRTDQMVTATNSVTVPVDETTVWDTSSPQVGIQAYWTAEAGQKATSKPALQQVQVSLYKLAVLIPMTDELLEDVPAMDTYLRRKAPEKIGYMVNEAIINGTGIGQPVGITSTYNNALVVVASESGQAADTVRYGNLLDMYVRMPGPMRSNAVWVINQAVEPHLYRMVFDPSVASSVQWPVYMPPGGASASPFGTLLGRPVIVHQGSPAIGDAGDILFVDFSQYLSVTKGGGVRTDVSIHLWFDYDITAYRFVLRIGGRPWWNSAASPATGTLTLSPYIALGAR